MSNSRSTETILANWPLSCGAGLTVGTNNCLKKHNLICLESPMYILFEFENGSDIEAVLYSIDNPAIAKQCQDE